MVGGVIQSLLAGDLVVLFQTEGLPWQGLVAVGKGTRDRCLSDQSFLIKGQSLVL